MKATTMKRTSLQNAYTNSSLRPFQVAMSYHGTLGTETLVSATKYAHSFALPGHYTVTSTSTSVDTIEARSVEVTVERKATVESDNMECVCTPTAKATVINLIPLAGSVSYQGVVTVVHDGSSESCSLRNPLQECHVRVFLERTIDGSVVSQEVLFDDTFSLQRTRSAFRVA